MTINYTVVGVKFKRAGKTYFFDPLELKLNPGDPVIVETYRGQEYGEVTAGNEQVSEERVVLPLKSVLRKTEDKDLQTLLENRKLEEDAFRIGQEKIGSHNLKMKLIDVEYTFDRSKVIFYFTAEGRVDFRQLVKDLAGVFRTRIELRQIGVRDEAKMIGGLGTCGRGLCCATFLGEFEPVSIRMAKEQNLSLNPAKISGVCGRLMCCLRYESCCYENAQDQFPGVGETIITDEGEAIVVSQQPAGDSVTVENKETGQITEVPVKKRTPPCRRQ